VLGDGAEEVADPALGRPAAQTEPATGPEHAAQLGRGDLVARREHHPEGRDHGVEAGVGERERLRVADHPFDLHAGGGGTAPPGLEQLRGDVRAHDARAGLRRGQRSVAAAAGDVKHGLARLQAEPVDDPAPDRPGAAGDGVEVARGPHGPGAVAAVGRLGHGDILS
jgi:hypothetical protein